MGQVFKGTVLVWLIAIAFSVLGILLTGCQSDIPDKATQESASNLYAVEDKERGVVCYKFKMQAGISCLHLKKSD